MCEPIVWQPGTAAYESVRMTGPADTESIIGISTIGDMSTDRITRISEHASRPMTFTPIAVTGRKRKRHKIRDQIRGGLDSPPKICEGIQGVDTAKKQIDQRVRDCRECASGENDHDHHSFEDGIVSTTVSGLGLMLIDRGLSYICPSKTRPGENYRIELAIENGKTVFTCSCDHMQGETVNSTRNSCSHIRATTIKIVLDLITSHQTAIDVNEITDLMNAMMM